jgi:Fur family ferric uptake transcriptional regulator
MTLKKTGKKAKTAPAWRERVGMKLTRQRQRIGDVFFEKALHRTVDEIWQEVKELEPRVSLATVYRTLKLFQDKGLARSHEFGDGRTRFEPELADDTHHDHLICLECKNIVEFFDGRIEALQDKVAAEHGFKVLHHRMELYGLCGACQNTHLQRSVFS